MKMNHAKVLHEIHQHIVCKVTLSMVVFDPYMYICGEFLLLVLVVVMPLTIWVPTIVASAT